VTPFDFRPRTRVVFGQGEFNRLGELAREIGAARSVVVGDAGIASAGYLHQAVRSLKARRVDAVAFDQFQADPTVDMVEAAHGFAQSQNPDLIVAVGGRSSLNLAKALNVVLCCGGSIRDYWGYGNVSKALLPLIAVPTTCGSEAQTITTIFDSSDRSRHTCGDPKLAHKLAILDPNLLHSQPAALAAASGFSAIATAWESLHSSRRNMLSESLAREAWFLQNQAYERSVAYPNDNEAKGALLWSAYLAGTALEYSSPAAIHACAKPLMDDFHLSDGAAGAILLAPVLAHEQEPAEVTQRLQHLAEVAGLQTSLRAAGVPESALSRLADKAAAQWSAKFSTPPLNAEAALEIYRSAW